jgi:uncharacterized protein (TIGR02147 family)
MEHFFTYLNYRDLTRFLLARGPKNGWGQMSRLAKHISVSSTFVSQILAEEKDFSPEQAVGAAEFLGLSEVQTDYYLTLVELSRAGTPQLKAHIQIRLKKIQTEASSLKKKIASMEIMGEEAKSIFYSQWYFSAIRLITSIPKYNTRLLVAEYFNLPKDLVNQTIDFLLQQGLVIEKNGKLSLGTRRTYIAPDSMQVALHHLNWRAKSMGKIAGLSSTEMMFTAPLTISKKDFERIRNELKEKITDIFQSIETTNPEILSTLTIDFLKY